MRCGCAACGIESSNARWSKTARPYTLRTYNRITANNHGRIVTGTSGLSHTSGVKPLDDIAKERHVSSETMLKIIEANLRKMAVSPEWQMVKQLIRRQEDERQADKQIST